MSIPLYEKGAAINARCPLLSAARTEGSWHLNLFDKAGNQEFQVGAKVLVNASEYFLKKISTKDVVSSFSGIRSLFDDTRSEAKAATRDYVLKLDTGSNEAPLLSIYGGKITTYRKLAESVLARLSPFLPPMRAGWMGISKTKLQWPPAARRLRPASLVPSNKIKVLLKICYLTKKTPESYFFVQKETCHGFVYPRN